MVGMQFLWVWWIVVMETRLCILYTYDCYGLRTCYFEKVADKIWVGGYVNQASSITLMMLMYINIIYRPLIVFAKKYFESMLIWFITTASDSKHKWVQLDVLMLWKYCINLLNVM